MKKIFLPVTVAASMIMAGVVHAQATLEVGATKPFATVQAAVDAAANNDIIVIDPGVYVGGVHVNEKSLTIRGADLENRPVLALQSHASIPGPGFATTGFLITGDDITVSVSDLITIPATTNSAIRAFQTSNITDLETITVNFENILITGNNGSDAPSVTDPFDTTTPIGTRFTSDGMYLVNRAFLASLRNGVGKYTLTDVVVIGAGRDGIITYVTGVADPQAANAAEAFQICEGVIIARTERNFIQWGNGNDGTGTYTITGTKERPGLIAFNNGLGTDPLPSGITVNGLNGAGTVEFDHVVFVNNTHPFYFSLGTTNSPSVTISDSLFANITTDDAVALSGAGTGAISVTNSTFFNNGVVAENTAGLWLNATATSGATVSGNLFSGPGQGGIIISTGAGSNVTIEDNGFQTVGSFALAEEVFGGGAADATITGSVVGNPGLLSVSVNSLAALQTAFNFTSQDFEDTSGWGEYIEETSINNWEM